MRYASLPSSFPSLCRVNTRQVACYCAMLTLEQLIAGGERFDAYLPKATTRSDVKTASD